MIDNEDDDGEDSVELIGIVLKKEMTIKDIIVNVADQLSYNQVSKTTTTEFAFNLITRSTPKLLLIFAFLITVRQLFGLVFVMSCMFIFSCL